MENVQQPPRAHGKMVMLAYTPLAHRGGGIQYCLKTAAESPVSSEKKGLSALLLWEGGGNQDQ
jgi:hypothetical protein